MTNRVHALGFSEKELAILNARVDASVLDEDAWEDATDESGVDCEMLCHLHRSRERGKKCARRQQRPCLSWCRGSSAE